MTATIAALFVYPVKSCRGLQRSAALVTERGLAHDREWMIVDAAGRFVSQREVPRLALIVPALSAAALELTAPGMAAVTIPFDRSGVTLPVTVWRDSCPRSIRATPSPHGFPHGSAPPRVWSASTLGCVVRDPAYAGDTEAHTAFADAYPLLELSEASLADLNQRLGLAAAAESLPAERRTVRGRRLRRRSYRRARRGGVTMKLVKPLHALPDHDHRPADRRARRRAIGDAGKLPDERYDALGGVAFGPSAMLSHTAGALADSDPCRRCGDAIRSVLSDRLVPQLVGEHITGASGGAP
jgi:uncharacterized protein YcbX